jgi:ubiquinone biosynthesis protein
MAATHAVISKGRRWARYREIAKVLYEERVLNLLKDSGLAEHAPVDLSEERIAELEKSDVKKLPHEVRVRLALERLGPAFVKAGQLLSTRRDLISPALANELAKLQDDVPTVPFAQIRERMEDELGGSIDDLYGSFDPEPLASASIGQVYRATLKDGTEVVVKVQRPNITETMEVDLDIIMNQAHWAARHTKWGSQMNVVDIAQELVDALRSELDYLHEAHSLDFFRTSFGDSKEVYFPTVYWDLTTSHVLTMEKMDGIPGTHLDELDEKGIDRKEVAINGTGCYFKQIFQLGRYHADPHLGNLFIMPDGRVGFVDFGRVGYIGERNRILMFQLLLALMEGDEVALTETMVDVTRADPTLDITGLQRDMARVCSAYGAAQVTGDTLAPAVQSMFDAMRTHRLALPGEIVLLLTVLSVLEGVARQLSGGAFQMTDVVQPMARKLLPEEFGPEHMKKYVGRWLRRSSKFLDDLPVAMTRVMRRAGEGEFRVAVRPDRFQGFMDRAEVIVNRLCLALMLTGLIVGMSFLSALDVHPVVKIVSRIVLALAILFGIWWAATPLRTAWRRRMD